jgi:hypothetical protein
MKTFGALMVVVDQPFFLARFTFATGCSVNSTPLPAGAAVVW